MDWEADSRRGKLRSERQRVAECEARRWAVARPMPDAAPVMAMTRPEREDMVFEGWRKRGEEKGGTDMIVIHRVVQSTFRICYSAHDSGYCAG